MRRISGWLCVMACAVLVSCAPGGGVLAPGDKPPIAAVGDAVVVEGGRALILANATYKVVGTAAAIGIEQGLITGAAKARVKAASARVADALVKGQTALATGDKAVSAAEAMRGLDELCTLAPALAAACALVK